MANPFKPHDRSKPGTRLPPKPQPQPAPGAQACPRCSAHVEHNCAAKRCPVGVGEVSRG